MEILGFVGSLLMGISLGLLGAGGGILCVPLLIYFHGMAPSDAAGHSLLIVGTAAFVAALGYYKRKEIDLPHGIVFGLPSLVSIFVTRSLIMPYVPAEILGIKKDFAIMALFAVLMVLAARSMIKPVSIQRGQVKLDLQQKFKVMLRGIFVGFLSGVVGVGGGFLIIPVLVVMVGLPMKIAVGTSLALIAVNSFAGFIGGMASMHYNWPLLAIYLVLSVVGIFIGTKLSSKISADLLKPAFGWFVLGLGLFILLQQIHSSLI